MAKKRSYQRRKVLHDKITNWMLFSFFALLGAVFFFFGVRQISVVNNIESRNTKTYTGTYTLDVFGTKNIKYLFTLGNGDRILVDELAIQQLLDSGQLCFEYTGPKNGIHFAYTGVRISSTDGWAILLSHENGLKEAKSQIFNYFFVFSLCLVVFIIFALLFVDIPSFIHQHRQQNKKNPSVSRC